MHRNPNARHLVLATPAQMVGSFRDDLVAAEQPSVQGTQVVSKSNPDLEALPSSTLRWRYNLMPEPTKFEISMGEYQRERRLAERILAERDPAEPAAPTPAPTLPPSASDSAVDLTNLAPQVTQPNKGDIPEQARH